MNKLVEFLRAHDDFIIQGHINPDGDAAGSTIAAALALKALGKRAFVYLPDGMPQRYAAFDIPVDFTNDIGKLPFAPETAFSIDTATVERLGEGKKVFDSVSARCLLDHHPTNPGYADVNFIDGEAAASGELIVELIGRLGVEMTRDMATWLYIAISTDCGQFGFASTRPRTFAAAGECVRTGIDLDRITLEVFRARTLARTRVLGEIIHRMQLSEDGKICWARLSEADFAALGARHEDSDGAVNYLLEIQGVVFACVAEEIPTGTKFSMRSKTPLNVAKEVAVPLGGGGHPNAAGVSMKLSMDEALKRVLDQARMAVDKLAN